MLPANGPQQHSRQVEHVASINLSGAPFSLWAGPVALATGFEYRNEAYLTTADPYGNGVTSQSPYSAANPADPVLNPAGNNWYAGNFHDGTGSYHVYEVYLEQNLPLLKWAAIGEANLNAAVRQTKYSTSGNVTAWKVGGTWKTPIDGLSFRAVTSRDIRAPNLSELFAEVNARLDIPLGERTFHLITRADRIERLADGRYAILDYKTGTTPTEKQVRTGLSPQLTLEGAIVRAGAFPNVPKGVSLAEYVYVAVRGGDPAGEAKPIEFKEGDPNSHADDALARLIAILARFEDEEMPYRSLVSPMWKTRYGDYDHLARVKEWSAGAEDEEDVPR